MATSLKSCMPNSNARSLSTCCIVGCTMLYPNSAFFSHFSPIFIAHHVTSGFAVVDPAWVINSSIPWCTASGQHVIMSPYVSHQCIRACEVSGSAVQLGSAVFCLGAVIIAGTLGWTGVDPGLDPGLLGFLVTQSVTQSNIVSVAVDVRCVRLPKPGNPTEFHRSSHENI